VAQISAEKLEPGDVRVRVGATGLCGTDFALVGGTLGLNAYPVILGHEVSGTVVESRSRLVDVGQRVILDPIRSCGWCWACAQGTPRLCDEVEVIGVASDGGCRDEVVLPGEHWVPIPSKMELEDAVLVEPVHVAATTYRAIAADRPDSVLVIGAGAIGLMLLALLRHWRPRTAVFISDVLPERVRRAEQWGAKPLAAGSDDRFDCVVDGVGSATSMRICGERARRGGTIVVYGVPKSGADLPQADQLFRKNARVVFSRLYDRDFKAAIGVIADGVITASNLVGTRLTIDSAAPFLNGRGWADSSHWGKALVLIGDDQHA
jgi:L-gulonate 5-dehydrogenase